MRCEMATAAERQAALESLEKQELALLVEQAEKKYAEVGDAEEGS